MAARFAKAASLEDEAARYFAELVLFNPAIPLNVARATASGPVRLRRRRVLPSFSPRTRCVILACASSRSARSPQRAADGTLLADRSTMAARVNEQRDTLESSGTLEKRSGTQSSKHNLLVCSIVAIAIELAACASTTGVERPHSESVAPTNQELAAYERASSIFESYCAKCHTTEGGKSSATALAHLNMDNYPFGGHHAHEVTVAVRKALGAAGSAPTMPADDPGAVRGEELRLILEWADAYERAHANAATPGKHDHEHGASVHEH